MGVNVNFKRGTQASLMALSSYVDGTFYLTTDTNRLYFCQSGSLVDLNQYIHMTTLSRADLESENLPKTSTTGYANLQQGDIYYWSNLNILAICDNPSTGAWTQINPDTYVVPSLQNFSFSTTANQVTLNLLVEDSKDNQSKGSFSLVGGTNVQLSQSGSTITISSTDTNDNATYTLSTVASSVTNTGVIQLGGTGTGGTDSSITLEGTGSVEIERDATSGNIVINGRGGLDSLIPQVDTTGNFGIRFHTTDGTSNSATILPVIAYGTNAATTAAFVGGPNVTTPVATLDVYTKAEVEGLITQSERTADAMSYAGLVNSSNFNSKIVSTIVANQTPANGTTYKAEDSFTLGDGREVNAGDLLIASGEDGNVSWDIVPSGDDQTIRGGALNNGIWISDQDGTTASPSIAALYVNGSTSTYGTITVSSTTANKVNNLIVAHGAAGTGATVNYATATTLTTQVYDSAISIPTITSISKDDAGHITAITGATYELKDTHNYITSLGITSSASNNSATVMLNVTDYDQNPGINTSFRIRSDNLEVTSASNNGAYEVTTNLVWGTF